MSNDPESNSNFRSEYSSSVINHSSFNLLSAEPKRQLPIGIPIEFSFMTWASSSFVCRSLSFFVSEAKTIHLIAWSKLNEEIFLHRGFIFPFALHSIRWVSLGCSSSMSFNRYNNCFHCFCHLDRNCLSLVVFYFTPRRFHLNGENHLAMMVRLRFRSPSSALHVQLINLRWFNRSIWNSARSPSMNKRADGMEKRDRSGRFYWS